MRFFWALALLSSALGVSAAPSPLVRILLPLYVAQPVPGADGSVWQSQFVMHNGASAGTYFIATCPPNEDCYADSAADEELLPGETQVGLPARYPLASNPVGGALLYLLPDLRLNGGDSVAFQLRVFDLSRSATAAGTEIPVIREHQFRTSTVHLLNVPTDSRFRLALRLFEMNLNHAQFSVRVIDQSTNDVLSTHLLTTVTNAVGGFVPGFAQLPALLSGTPSPSRYVRIEIEPLTAGVAFWSYVSITNNDSQQVTLVTPQ